MKKHIIYLSGALLVLTACDENSWNDHLDGYEGNQGTAVVKNINYTLTATDYSTISTLADNIALAGDANADALAAVKTNCYFTDAISPLDYIPAFLSNSKFEYNLLDDGSRVTMTYNMYVGQTEELSLLQTAATYTVTSADYQEAWGSDEDYINAFSYNTKPTKNIPALLNAGGFDSDYVLVTYNYADQEPIFSTVSSEVDLTSYQYLRVDALEDGDDFIIASDGYAATSLAESKTYGYLYDPIVVETDNYGIKSVPEDLTERNIWKFKSTDGGYYWMDCYGRYMYQSGTYTSYNVTTDSSTAGAVWTDQLVDNTLKLSNENGYWVQYSASYSSYGVYAEEKGDLPCVYKKNLNYAGASKSPKQKAAVVEVPTTTVYALYKKSSNGWTEDTSVAVVQPADYTSMGATYISSSNASVYLPTYMSGKYPYAQEDDEKYVVYFNSSSKAIGASLMTYDGSAWVADNGVVEQTIIFKRINGVWGENVLDVYTHLKVDEIESGGKYLIVTDEFAATSLLASYTYGYIQITNVETDGTRINVDDPELIEFTLTKESDGWTIQDCYGRYYYQTGTYNSFNVYASLETSLGGFYWDIDLNDGMATITNKQVSKTWQYDESYGSYGSYSTISHTLPSIYKQVEE